MRVELRECEICLAENRPLRLSGAAGLRIVCTAGVVWLTVEGEAGDIFLHPGQSHRVDSRGLALLEAIGAGRVRLQPRASWMSRQRMALGDFLAPMEAARPAP